MNCAFRGPDHLLLSVDEPDFHCITRQGFLATKATHSVIYQAPWGILKDGPTPRLYCVFLSSLSGRKLWLEFRHRRRSRQNTVDVSVFDIGFGEVVELDNTRKI